MFIKRQLACLACATLFLALPAAHATNPVTEIHVGNIPKGTVALGVGVRWGDSPYRGIDDIGSLVSENDYDIMPFYFYEGRWLFAHGSSAGVHFLDSEHFELDALISYRFTRLETERDDYFRTVEDRQQSLDAGFRAGVKGDLGKLRLTWLGGAVDRHNGNEVDLTYRYEWLGERWSISPFVSYVYQDSDLTGYYYGVTPRESRPDLPAYTPGSADFLRVGVNTSYRLTQRMRLFANFSHENLDDEVRDSPLVDEDSLYSVMVGMAYAFGNTMDDSAIVRRNPERAGEWSWRINYGYTAEETFHKVHRGAIRKNEDVDTNLVGLTFGKLLLDGPRADYWGKLSINRRLENDLQDDFWEANAYVMIMGTGYSPWTSRELFRYGFGYGFSYADKIPIVEQLKQASRGENTSHFLNYLEAQVDFPLRNMFGNRGWGQDCYAGLTIVHRSGIFGTVDILGNVSGGSDVLTGHMECRR